MKMTFEQFNKMKEAGLSEDQIQTIAQKKGIKVPSEGLLGGVARQVVVEPAMRVGQALGYGIAKLAGATPEQLDRASKRLFHNTTYSWRDERKSTKRVRRRRWYAGCRHST